MVTFKKHHPAFTIVELLIVIVVIAILTAVSVVAFSGLQNRANSTAILSEANEWKKLFQAYKAANGDYPSPVASGDPSTSGGPGSNMLNSYCLGSGFPQSSGSSYCHAVNSTSTYRVAESTGLYLLSELSAIGTPPSNSKKFVYGNVVGPFLQYLGVNNLRIWSTFPPGTSCTSMKMSTGFGDSSRQDCYFPLN